MIDNHHVGRSDLHEEEIESRYEAVPAVVLVIGLQVTLALVTTEGGRKVDRAPGVGVADRSRTRGGAVAHAYLVGAKTSPRTAGGCAAPLRLRSPE
jgi:hypothetical protein